MTLNDEDMDTFVFAVGTKKAMARLQKEMQDLVNTLLQCDPYTFSHSVTYIVKTSVCLFFYRVSSAVTSLSLGPSMGSQTPWLF